MTEQQSSKRGRPKKYDRPEERTGIYVRCDKSLRRRLNITAVFQEKPVSEIVAQAIEDYLAKNEPIVRKRGSR